MRARARGRRTPHEEQREPPALRRRQMTGASPSARWRHQKEALAGCHQSNPTTLGGGGKHTRTQEGAGDQDTELDTGRHAGTAPQAQRTKRLPVRLLRAKIVRAGEGEVLGGGGGRDSDTDRGQNQFGHGRGASVPSRSALTARTSPNEIALTAFLITNMLGASSASPSAGMK